jgi:aminoacyl tRNA synthase complex-interacting multifunctional protein 1
VRISADALSPAFPLVSFNLNDAPIPERKDASKKKEMAVGKTADVGKVTVTDEAKVAPAAVENLPKGVDGKKDSKDKKERKKDGTAAEEKGKKAVTGGKATAVEELGDPVPSMVDLRVGHIVDGEFICSWRRNIFELATVMKHPDADGLYVEVCFLPPLRCFLCLKVTQQIDIGEEGGPRTVVSGLVHYIPIEQMRGKYIVAVVCCISYFVPLSLT